MMDAKCPRCKGALRFVESDASYTFMWACPECGQGWHLPVRTQAGAELMWNAPAILAAIQARATTVLLSAGADQASGKAVGRCVRCEHDKQCHEPEVRK